MAVIELYINNVSVDFGEAARIQLDKAVADFRDALKKTGTYSLPLVLPYTQRNIAIFNGENDKQLLGKFRQSYAAKLVVNNQVLIEGRWLQLKNTPKGFEGAVGEVVLGNPKIGDVLGTKKLVDIKSFAPLDFRGSATVGTSWETTVAYPDAETCFPWVARSFSDFKPAFGRSFTTTYEDLGISHFAAAILTNIFKDAGYTLDGEIFGNATFQKLVLLYSSSAKQLWNYGTLAPMRSECALPLISFGGVYEGGTTKTIERQSDFIYVFSYPFHATQGDLCNGLGGDGVYTCKFSGVYTLTVRGDAVAGNGSSAPLSAFTAFRCISDEATIPDTRLPGATSFATLPAEFLDAGTIAVGNSVGDTDMTFTTRLEEGKQYALQRYISVPKTAPNAGTQFFYNPNSGKFHLTSVEAPLVVNPASFLPEMTQSEFVAAIFKIFNLYYQLNQEQKTITLLTRDAFFQDTLQDLVDLTPFLNVKSMEESPLSEKEIGQTYLSYAPDESDHLLKHTDYLERVNGIQPEESTPLPFAPLGFLRLPYAYPNASGVTVRGEDLVAAILPAQESEDSSVLDDVETATRGGSWVPRLLLYQGTDWLKTLQVTTPLGTVIDLPVSVVNVGRATYVPGNIFVGGGMGSVTYEYVGTPPKLGFFDYAAQPSYAITTDTTLRSFAVVLATTPTIYDAGGNPDFLQDVARIPELNTTSLATNINPRLNPKGFFYQLYSNDLLTGNLSNYFEGVGRMNPVLFTRLTGRQVLRLNNDLFLLDALKNYDVAKELVTYRVYKLVTKSGVALSTSTRYTATRSFTASCATGSTGTDQTATATRSSYLNQATADASALAAAAATATALLQCALIVVEFTSTQSFTAYCAFGYNGPASTETVTYISTISQADADAIAAQQAEAAATAALSCTADPDPQ